MKETWLSTTSLVQGRFFPITGTTIMSSEEQSERIPDIQQAVCFLVGPVQRDCTRHYI